MNWYISAIIQLLAKDPYNIIANFRLAYYNKSQNKIDEAKKQIKRIVIRENTDIAVKKLYRELIKKSPTTEQIEEVNN